MWEPVVLSRKDTVLSSPTKSFLWSISQWTYSQFQSVSGSDAADLKNNLTQTRSFEFSDSTEIGGIWIPFSPTKSLLWRMFLFSPSGPATNSSQYLALMQLISNNLGSSELSDSTEIGGILIPFPPSKSLLWKMFLFSPSGPACYQFQSVSGSLKYNLTQTWSFEFSDSTEILIPFPPTKSLLWRMFLFSPSGPATTFHNSSQYLALMQLISKIISHKPGHLSFPILLNRWNIDTISPRMFLFSPSGPATTIHNSSQYLALMQLISNIISHKPGHIIAYNVLRNIDFAP